MRCNICDRLLNEPRFNRELGSYEPCETCMEVIQDTLAGFKDRVAVDDDELGVEDSFGGVYIDRTDKEA